LLLSIFVVSGFTGLIYESIWSHYLKLFLGHAAYAQSLVLAIFMGGMAVGAWLVAHYSLRIRQLLLAYAGVEAAIGVLGLCFHPVFIAASNFGDSRAAIGRLGTGLQVVVGRSAHPAAIRAARHDLPAHQRQHHPPLAGSAR
jgi:predicted membrane-bound spermidine synthase